jgi:hypothetical protein
MNNGFTVLLMSSESPSQLVRTRKAARPSH